MGALRDKHRTSEAARLNASGRVSSRQREPHPRLREHVERHLDSRWLQPLHLPTVEAYGRLRDHPAFRVGRPLVLDSGCGTGYSTRRLAERFPNSLVIGADRSLARLARGGAASGFAAERNLVLLRAELASLWRLLLAEDRQLQRHYLLYPNPWPKAAHLGRRWHAHPVFPELLALGGEIEMRTNWKLYALEFAQAAGIACGEVVEAREFQPQEPLSRFEEKYHARGQTLFQVTVPQVSTANFRSYNTSRGKVIWASGQQPAGHAQAIRGRSSSVPDG